jgi:predicted type IV restriction endonuclease
MRPRPWLHPSMHDLDPLGETLWDAFRRKHVKATPEEWVRQDALRRLVIDAGYPKEAISVERGIQLHGMLRRFDIAVFFEGKLWMLIECKSDDIPLNERVTDQWMRYNLTTQAPWGALTNGKSWQIFHAEGPKSVPMLPAFGTFVL